MINRKNVHAQNDRELPPPAVMRAELSRLVWLMSHPQKKAHDDAIAFGACMALLWVLGDKASNPSAITRKVLIRHLERLQVPHCKVCGCTDHFACAGGCAWYAPGLCSKCAPATLTLANMEVACG